MIPKRETLSLRLTVPPLVIDMVVRGPFHSLNGRSWIQVLTINSRRQWAVHMVANFAIHPPNGSMNNIFVKLMMLPSIMGIQSLGVSHMHLVLIPQLQCSMLQLANLSTSSSMFEIPQVLPQEMEVITPCLNLTIVIFPSLKLSPATMVFPRFTFPRPFVHQGIISSHKMPEFLAIHRELQ